MSINYIETCQTLNLILVDNTPFHSLALFNSTPLLLSHHLSLFKTRPVSLKKHLRMRRHVPVLACREPNQGLESYCVAGQRFAERGVLNRCSGFSFGGVRNNFAGVRRTVGGARLVWVCCHFVLLEGPAGFLDEGAGSVEKSARSLLRLTQLAANLRTKILDFRGFDPSRISILRSGFLMSIGNSPAILNRRILVGIILVGRLGVGQPGICGCPDPCERLPDRRNRNSKACEERIQTVASRRSAVQNFSGDGVSVVWKLFRRPHGISPPPL